MLVSAAPFFVFLIIVCLVYWAAARSRRLQLAVLVAANLFFLARFSLIYLALPLAAQTAPQAPSLAEVLSTVRAQDGALEEAALGPMLAEARRSQGEAWDRLEAPPSAVPPFALICQVFRKTGDRVLAPVQGTALVPLKCWSIRQEYLVAAAHGAGSGKLTRVGQRLQPGVGDVLSFTDAEGNAWEFAFDLTPIYAPLQVLLKATGDVNAAMRILNARGSLPEPATAALKDLQEGRWAQAVAPGRRKELASLCPDLPLSRELDLLAELLGPKPAAQPLVAAADALRRLMPFHPKIQTLCGLAYLAAGRPQEAGAQKAWCLRLAQGR